MTPWLLFVIACGMSVAVLGRWRRETLRHDRRLAAVDVRIHVNGIRGKSTVARIVAGLLRAADYTTVAKTTGTSAVLIGPDGVDVPIQRRGAATIIEQLPVIEECERVGANALVAECMALNPTYQSISERRMIRSTIGILTNVREDHQDVMGVTLPEIAHSLLNTCPDAGVLVTAEQDPELQELLRDEASRRGSELIVVDPNQVTDEELELFDYIAFKENVAIGLVIAAILEIPREIAMQGMVEAAGDPGALRLQQVTIGPKRVTWANLFAVNDRQSVIGVMDSVLQYRTEQTTTVGILNNRLDREDRALQFADIVTQDLCFNRLVTFGAYERIATDRVVQRGFPRRHVIALGDSVDPDIDHILRNVIENAPTEHVLLVGLVNIHTRQAELLLEYFNALEHRVVQPREVAA